MDFTSKQSIFRQYNQKRKFQPGIKWKKDYFCPKEDSLCIYPFKDVYRNEIAFFRRIGNIKMIFNNFNLLVKKNIFLNENIINN